MFNHSQVILGNNKTSALKKLLTPLLVVAMGIK